MNYPPEYRSTEIQLILKAARAGESTLIVGLSGCGKSNVLAYLAQRTDAAVTFMLVDCNRLAETTLSAFLRLIRRSFGDLDPTPDEFVALEAKLRERFATTAANLCLLFDRFDTLPAETLSEITSNLRALRDGFKYRLSYVIATRQPLDAHTELAELFFARTLWLGALSTVDARWSISEYSRRVGCTWNEDTYTQIITISRGYPSFLRAVCEAHTAGAPLDPDALRTHPAIAARLAEFWADAPSQQALQRSGLADHPWLRGHLDWTDSLTVHERRLLDFFQAHPGQVCSKDDLIRAVWTEDKAFGEGIRDDSLAQLIHRLRDKLEPDPKKPRRIVTLPGRGYRYTPE